MMIAIQNMILNDDNQSNQSIKQLAGNIFHSTLVALLVMYKAAANFVGFHCFEICNAVVIAQRIAR